MVCPYAIRAMTMFKLLMIGIAAATAAMTAPGAEAQRRDSDAAYSARQAGTIRPLSEIEGRVMPRMGGASYLGPEFDAGSSTYRLKFMRSGSVIWVDVDGRTGQIVGRTDR